MQSIIKQVAEHFIAILIFLGITIIYFAPAVFQGKTIQQPDMIQVAGMGTSQSKQYEETAKPREFSLWSDAMFGGMPYNAVWGSPAPKLPGLDFVELSVKKIGYMNAGMIFAPLVCFYILMCAMGIRRWLAIAGSIAFAFATYNIVIIEVGHITKAYVIAYMPLTIAGMILLFKRKYIWGAVIFLLGTSLSILNSHIQITYYLMLLCLCIFIGFIIKKIKEKDFKELGKVTAIMAICSCIAVLPSAGSLYTQWDLGKTSLRGATELTTTTQEGEKISSGLDKDYAFQWSYGKAELLTLLIPGIYGGSSTETLDSKSEMYKTIRSAGNRDKKITFPLYWGDKSTSGPVYFGAVVCFLFLLGMFVIKNPMKWYFFAGAVFLTLLSLGRNLDWFNSFIFHYMPFYNKFRTVEMALVIPGFVFPIIAFWGLKEILEGNIDKKLLKRGLIWSLSIPGLICLIIWWFPELFFNFQSNSDALREWDKMPWYDGLLRDRIHLASSDAFRSLAFVLLSSVLIFIFMQIKNKKQGALILGIGFTLLTLADLWMVDKRYLNESNFKKEKLNASFKETVADTEILKDKDLSYRVLLLSNATFTESTVSYFHHSIGGYHPAKLRRYQELIDHRLYKEMGIIGQSFPKENVTLESIQQSFEEIPSLYSLNMLNTRYIIFNPDYPPIFNPHAYGNAWFVPEIKIVENADAEIAALDIIDPLQTAVVDKRFTDLIGSFRQSQPDSTATIVLDNYRPNRLTYTSKTNSEQLAVFSEIYYQSGWKATIDGQPAPHFRVNWTLRAMLVPAGEHKIEFEFRPDGFVKAAYVSTFSSFLVLLLLISAVAYSIYNTIGQKKKNQQ